MKTKIGSLVHYFQPFQTHTKNAIMVTSSVTYKNGLTTEAIHQKSGTQIITDAPTDNNGLGRSFSPTDLLATSLASCMLTIMGIRANASDLNIDDSKAEVTKIMGDNPRCVSEIKVEIEVADRGLSDAQKSVLEKAAQTCPVGLSLSHSLKQTVSFSYRK
ncbi:MAG: putative redox protein [Bacteroidia bacterium]|jgi:putative redox protein